MYFENLIEKDNENFYSNLQPIIAFKESLPTNNKKLYGRKHDKITQ